MISNFVVEFDNGRPLIPVTRTEDDLQLSYVVDGIRVGGYACLSEAPALTVIVQVNADAATIAAMKLDTASYLWLEDVSE